MSRSLIPSLLNELDDIRNFFHSDIEKYESSNLSVYENADKIFVEAAMPGMDTKDICLNFEKGVLWIKGESHKDEKDVKYHLKASKSFSYRVPLPSRIDDGASPQAIYKNGIIKITFNKSKGTKSQKIEIQSE